MIQDDGTTSGVMLLSNNHYIKYKTGLFDNNKVNEESTILFFNHLFASASTNSSGPHSP